jgi:hypothetical protein
MHKLQKLRTNRGIIVNCSVDLLPVHIEVPQLALRNTLAEVAKLSLLTRVKFLIYPGQNFSLVSVKQTGVEVSYRMEFRARGPGA